MENGSQFVRSASLGRGLRANLHGTVGESAGDLNPPKTGLSLLMGGGNVQNYSSSAASFASMSGMSTDGTAGYQEERERQASALAAAGMVAESVSVSNRPGLAAPPELASTVPETNLSGNVDNLNWGTMDGDVCGVSIDDMDLDFASLFDPSIEEAKMQTEGSGWPVSSTGAASTSTTAGPS